jgi:hypothetical protein
VWWPWVAVWAVTLVALLAAVAFAAAWLRSRSRPQLPAPFLSFYLNEQGVMDLYQYRYREPLEQRIVAVEGSTRAVGVGVGIPGTPVSFGGSVERNREVFRHYVEAAEPIRVIGILMRVLEDDLYTVDLDGLSIVAGKHLRLRRRTARLSELGASVFVLARGTFAMDASADAAGRTTTFVARFGPASLRVRCVTTGLRDDVPDGPFPARCLGIVQGWDSTSGQLSVTPLAIFR